MMVAAVSASLAPTASTAEDAPVNPCTVSGDTAASFAMLLGTGSHDRGDGPAVVDAPPTKSAAGGEDALALMLALGLPQACGTGDNPAPLQTPPKGRGPATSVKPDSLLLATDGEERAGPALPPDAAEGEVYSAADLVKRIQTLLLARSSGQDRPASYGAAEPAKTAPVGAAPLPALSGQGANGDGLPQPGNAPAMALSAMLPAADSGSSFGVALAAAAAPGAPRAAQVATGTPAPSQASLIAGDLGQSEAWLEGLTREIAAITSDHRTLRFRLDPSSLGKIDVEVQNAADKTTVSMAVASNASLVALQDAQPRLMADVRHAGLRDVEAHIFSGQGQSNPGRGQGEHQRKESDRQDWSSTDRHSIQEGRGPGRVTDRFA